MTFTLPIPAFLVRVLVKRHPWLLAENGRVRRAYSANVGPAKISAGVTISLPDATRKKLIAVK